MLITGINHEITCMELFIFALSYKIVKTIKFNFEVQFLSNGLQSW